VVEEVLDLDVEWSESAGPFYTVGRPCLFACLRAVFVGKSFADGRAVVVARQHDVSQWAETSGAVTLAEARQLATALIEVGLPDRAPRIQGVVDTSDGWSVVSVRVCVGEQVRAFKLAAQSSGFEGPDSILMLAIFRSVFRLAGYDQFNKVLYGRDEDRR
jgi:hypothetical protein